MSIAESPAEPRATSTTPLPHAPEPVISLRSVCKTFLTEELETRALDSIHLAVEPGEFVAIEGPSGSGKTTLLSVLGLLDPPTSGRYWLFGDSVEGLSRTARARVRNRKLGFVFQAFNLIGDLSARENVELPLLYAKAGKAERERRVTQALERVGMAHRSAHFPSQLSGGQQQRVAVARAIVAEPSLLLADEPTGNLDTRNGEAILQLLLELNRAGTTICMVSHNPDFCRLAHRVLHLSDGQLTGEQRTESAPARA